MNNDKYMIEIKPSRQVKKPETTKKKTKSYMKSHLNISRTKQNGKRKSYCDDNGMKFKLITEKGIRSILSLIIECLSK